MNRISVDVGPFIGNPPTATGQELNSHHPLLIFGLFFDLLHKSVKKISALHVLSAGRELQI